MKKLWSDGDDTRLQRSRTRDLSRQFRGEKRIDWSVVESYATLLYPDDLAQRTAQLETCRALYIQAFGPIAEGEPDGPEAPAIDPSYVADLEHQLAEARTRAAFATALLVIVRSENAVLRGKHTRFAWFESPQSSRDAEPAAPRTEGFPRDPVTAPIVRRQSLRNGQNLRRHSSIAFGALAGDAASRPPATAGPSRPGWPSPLRMSVMSAGGSSEVPDILGNREKKRRAKR